MFELLEGDCLTILPTLQAESVDAVITDPPYPEIQRDYGRMTEAEWHNMMNGVMPELKRVLKPSGSAMILLQANSNHVGQMRLWLWQFLIKHATQWNLIQDVYWWNITTPPTVHTHRTKGLMRPSVKMCCWFGSPNCYRNQDEVLWTESDSNKARAKSNMALKYNPCGLSMREGRCASAAKERGGTTPFNLIPMTPNVSKKPVNGASTPYRLAEWWIKYLCPVGGTILDPFAGVGTIGKAANDLNRNYIGIEQSATYIKQAQQWLISSGA